MKYTQIPATAFEEIQLNAGILVESFEPTTGTIGRLLGATTGGVNFTDSTSYTDFGEDIDNCPKNMMELKKLDSHEVTLSGTFVTLSANTAKLLAAVADVDELDETHIIPRNDVLITDFKDIWWIGDYSNNNTGDNAGFIAVHLLNSLNTGGFQIQSTDKGKGQFAFEFTGHYSMDAQDLVPYEIYIQTGNDSETGSILLNHHSITLIEGDDETLIATTKPTGETVTWTSGDSSVASVLDGVVTGEDVGNTIITATITVDGVTYSDTCTVIVKQA